MCQSSQRVDGSWHPARGACGGRSCPRRIGVRARRFCLHWFDVIARIPLGWWSDGSSVNRRRPLAQLRLTVVVASTPLFPPPAHTRTPPHCSQATMQLRTVVRSCVCRRARRTTRVLVVVVERPVEPGLLSAARHGIGRARAEVHSRRSKTKTPLGKEHKEEGE